MFSWFSFFTRFLGDRRHVGAVLPSSRALARAMAQAVGTLDPQDVIVELGPGTGALTVELMRVFPYARFVLIERDETFVRQLRTQFPSAMVVQGDAADLELLVKKIGVRPGAVVSGLPMLSLPKPTRNAVFSALEHVLSKGTRFVQFTYGPSAWKKIPLPGFHPVAFRRVWGNIPPAAVLTFEHT